jgi:phenazine biosynthesis protein PhzF family
LISNNIVYLVNAFTFQGVGGNPAGVVLHADSLPKEERQRIATKIGVSETAFVSRSEVADFKIEFYTPTSEIDFCGHATLATFWLMNRLGVLNTGQYCQESKVGVLGVEIDGQGFVTQEQVKPHLKGYLSAFDSIELFGMNKSMFNEGMPMPEIISTGVAEVLMQVPNGVLDKLNPNFELIERFSKEHNVLGFHIFEVNPAVEYFTASARNFAPLVGINEESATGSACGALITFMFRHYGIDEAWFEQGRVLGSPSALHASLDIQDDEIQKVYVKGTANLMRQWSLSGF